MKIRPILALIGLGLAFIIANPLAARAARHVLFESGAGVYGQVDNYDAIVRQLNPGDELVFSNGRTRRIGKLLGSGNTTLIFALADQPDRAIRIPKRRGTFEFNKPRFTEYVKDFQNGAEILQKANVPMVRVFDDLRPGEYSVVERLPKSITLRDFFLGKTIYGIERSTMENALVEFAKKTSAFERIGDFHFDQLYFHPHKKEWILMDWTRSHRKLPLLRTELIEVGTSIFVGPPQDRGKYFFEFLRVEEPRAMKIVFEPILKKDEWIARLANRIHAEIRQERVRRAPRVTNVNERIVPQRQTSNCAISSFWKRFF